LDAARAVSETSRLREAPGLQGSAARQLLICIYGRRFRSRGPIHAEQCKVASTTAVRYLFSGRAGEWGGRRSARLSERGWRIWSGARAGHTVCGKSSRLCRGCFPGPCHGRQGRPGDGAARLRLPGPHRHPSWRRGRSPARVPDHRVLPPRGALDRVDLRARAESDRGSRRVAVPAWRGAPVARAGSRILLGPTRDCRRARGCAHSLGILRLPRAHPRA